MASESEANVASQTGTKGLDDRQTIKNLAFTLQNGTKVKHRVPRQRACNETGEKGKICAGHLKRWYSFGNEIISRLGPAAEVYRCEHCQTLYLPNEHERPRTRTLSY